MTNKPRTIALALTAAALTAATASACSTTHDGKAEERTFSLPADAGTLTIDSDDSAIELVRVDREGTDIKVTRWFKAEKWNGKTGISWSQDGSTLTFREKCSGVFVSCDARHRVEVPKGLAVNVAQQDGSVRATGFTTPLHLKTRDGSITVDDSTAALTLTTLDGSIRVQNGVAPLKLSTRDGSIRATGLVSTDVAAETLDGSIRLAFTKTPQHVKAHTRDGSVRLAVPDTSYQVTADTRDGSVTVDVPRDDTSARTLDTRTLDGSITIGPDA